MPQPGIIEAIDRSSVARATVASTVVNGERPMSGRNSPWFSSAPKSAVEAMATGRPTAKGSPARSTKV